MKKNEAINDFESMGKRHRASVEITMLEVLLQKARLLGFSEPEIAKLRHQYGHSAFGKYSNSGR
ncbi:MAG: hypothetical protein COB78_00965 [Hyphomicrobiales bacterium]|nr:MAG: hypothetical protein COB78_00965 [Hyphomicrobiales bacterium]